MKKKKPPTPSHYLILLLLILLLSAALCACELESLTGPKDTESPGVNVFLPTDGSTTSPVATTVPLTTAPITTETPVTTTTSPVTTAAPVSAAPSPYKNPLTLLPSSREASSLRPIALARHGDEVTDFTGVDLLIEAPVEKGETRLLLLGCDPSLLLPQSGIASIRPHLIAFANDFFAITLYRGTSDHGRPSVSFLYPGIDLSEREEPSSLLDASLLTALIREKGYQDKIASSITLPYSHTREGADFVPSGVYSSYIHLPFSDTSSVSFTYDAVTRSYTMRRETPSTEAKTFTNVFVLFAESATYATQSGEEFVINSDRGGLGYYISSGRAMPISWSRDPETSRLLFKDQDGAPLVVNRGATYFGVTTFSYYEKVILN